MLLLSSYSWDWESNLLFSWQQHHKYVPSQVSESEFFIFPSSVYHLCLHWVLSLDMDKPLLESLSFPQSCLLVPLMVLSSPLPMLLELCSLLPPQTVDATLKSLSLKAFLANGQIPEFSNPAKIFFMISENGCAEVIILVRLRLVIFCFQDWQLSSHVVYE